MKKAFALILALMLTMAVLPVASVSADVGDHSYRESESNNSFGSANIIRNDYTISASVSEYDMDYYVFSVPQTSVFTMSCVADWSWLMCGLYDSNEELLTVATESWTSSGNPADSIFVTLSPGTYYLLFLNNDYYSDANDYMFYISIISNTHSHYYYSSVTYPTCTEGGYTTYTCSCGDSYVSDYTSKTGHYLSSWITIPATCTEAGEKYRYCYDCDYTESQAIPKIAHSYKAYVTPPTCEEEGYTTHVCSACGDYYIDTYTDKAKHSMGDWFTISSTCTVKGEKYRYCQNCSYSESIELSLAPHTFTNECDAFCNRCGTDRVPPHVYDNNCDTVCNQCGIDREPPHTFTDLHDAVCNDCGFERVIPDVIPGDINEDGRINNRDLGLLQQYLNDWNVAGANVFAMDVNDDGRANNRDLGLLQQYLNDWNVTLK